MGTPTSRQVGRTPCTRNYIGLLKIQSTTHQMPMEARAVWLDINEGAFFLGAVTLGILARISVQDNFRQQATAPTRR
jgi:hypothetical protein